MIKAECVAASFNRHRIATFKVTMPRNILAEAKTHRVISKTDEGLEILSYPGVGFNDDPYLSKNSASSRAIPSNKMLRLVKENIFTPIAWQKDHKGMQGTEYLDETGATIANSIWKIASAQAREIVSKLTNPIYGIEATKQITNRLLEPFMYHTVLVTATEFFNFFELRCPKYEIDLDNLEALK